MTEKQTKNYVKSSFYPLQQWAQKCEPAFDLLTFFHTDLIQSEASWKLSSTSDWLMFAWKNVS